MLDDAAPPSDVLDRLCAAWPDTQVSYDAGVLTLAPFEPLPALHVHLPLEQIDAMCRPPGPTLEVLWPNHSPEVAGAFWFATAITDVLGHPREGSGPSHVVSHEGRLLAVRDLEDADELARALEPRAPLSLGPRTEGRRLRAYAPRSGTWYVPRDSETEDDPSGQ